MSKVLVTPHMLVRQPGPYLDILENAGLEAVSYTHLTLPTKA